MPLAIELYFDDESDNRVRRLCSELAAARVPVPIYGGFRPHITMAIVASEHGDAAKIVVEKLARNTASFSDSLSAVGTFPGAKGIVFLVPSLSAELLSVHQRMHDEFVALGVPLSTLYSLGRWVPH